MIIFKWGELKGASPSADIANAGEATHWSSISFNRGQSSAIKLEKELAFFSYATKTSDFSFS